MKKLTILTALFVFLLVGASDVSACSCLMDNIQSTGKKVKKAFSQSSAVFYGEVLSVTRQENSVRVTFKVDKSWKGLTTGEAIVSTGENSAMCGFNFEVGKTYIVYANGSLQTNICTRTAAGNDDAKYLTKLKKPKVYLRKK